MHEFALAADIGRRLKAEARRAGRRLAAVDVEVGALDRIDAENLSFWLGETLREAAGPPAAVRVLRAAPALRCLRCGRARPLAPTGDTFAVLAKAARRCPACHSQRVRLEGGAGCRVLSMRFEGRAPVTRVAAAGKGR